MKTLDRANKATELGNEILRLEERLIKKLEAYNKKFGQAIYIENETELDAMTKEDMAAFDEAQAIVHRVNRLKQDLGA